MFSVRCVIHGSLRKHLALMGRAASIFREAGIEILAPNLSSISGEVDGFRYFRGEEGLDPRLVELLYLQNLKKLGVNGFSYFVNPGGYIGKSVSYELGIAQSLNVPCYFSNKIADHPAYIGENAVWSPEGLVEHLKKNARLPNDRSIVQGNAFRPDLLRLRERLLVPETIVSAGAIIEYCPERRGGSEPLVLMVKTHKWGGRFSIVGGKVRRFERLDEALRREVKEETGLAGKVGKHLCTFDEIKNSGYYDSTIQHLFVDNVVTVGSKKVILNEEAQEYIWMPARVALRELPIEPNARQTLQLYTLSSRNN